MDFFNGDVDTHTASHQPPPPLAQPSIDSAASVALTAGRSRVNYPGGGKPLAVPTVATSLKAAVVIQCGLTVSH